MELVVNVIKVIILMPMILIANNAINFVRNVLKTHV